MVVSIKSFTTASLNLSMETSAREGRREKEREGGSGGGGAGGGGVRGLLGNITYVLRWTLVYFHSGRGVGGGWM